MIVDNAHPFDILLVEDEPADAKLVRSALKESRVYCNLHHVADGVEALAFLRRTGGNYRQAPRPDLILLDLNMPRMNGREFLAAVKADGDLVGIPVVVLTTSDVERDVVASYKLGAAGYITKPVDMEQFVDAIRQIGSYWFTLTRLPLKT
ncbi:MAG: response regulator [Rhodocyclales bacterium]|nr:response regulator [Rhodocyclales bacterium]